MGFRIPAEAIVTGVSVGVDWSNGKDDTVIVEAFNLGDGLYEAIRTIFSYRVVKMAERDGKIIDGEWRESPPKPSEVLQISANSSGNEIKWWTDSLTRKDVIEYGAMRWERTHTDVICRTTPAQLKVMRYWMDIIEKKGSEGMSFLVSNPEVLSALRFYPVVEHD